MRKTFCNYGYATRHLDKSGGDPFIPAFMLSVDPEFFNLAIYRWRADQHRGAQRHRYGQPKRGPGLQSSNFSHPSVAFNSTTFGQSVRLRMFRPAIHGSAKAALASFNLA